MATINLTFDNNQAVLSGDLTRDTVVDITDEQVTSLVSSDVRTIELENISRIDSAGLAFLLTVVEKAEQKKCRLTFLHLPEDLLKLAKVSAVDSFLPV